MRCLPSLWENEPVMRFARYLLLTTAAFASASEPEDWFSHKKHAAAKLECAACHVNVEKGERAGFPVVGYCMLCHQSVARDAPLIRRLAELPKDASPFAKKFHRLPDFVFFSHQRHGKAKVECSTCHGEVNAQDRPRLHMALTMKACIDCHKANQATQECNACHELGQ